MSFEALSWAAKVRTDHSADKLVLLGLADCAGNESAEAYPSIAALCEFSSLNRKTVITALDRLIAAGHIVETGKQTGRTGQVKIYRLAMDNSAENGTVKQSQKRESLEANSPVFSRKQSQKRDTEPIREPIRTISNDIVISREAEKPVARKNAKAGCPLPESWEPVLTPSAQRIVDSWPPGRLPDEVDRFRDYADDKGRVSLDWQAAFRTWIRNSQKWSAPHGTPNRQHSAQTDRRDNFTKAIDEALDVIRNPSTTGDFDGSAVSDFAGTGGRTTPRLAAVRC